MLVSLFLLWHLAALFLAPLSIPPTSPLVSNIAQRRMQWYLDVLYLNHGYFFFAPNPGDGHIVRYKVFDVSGNTLREGEFPDRETQWPRLYYHRHFMLADQVGAGLPNETEPTYGPQRYLEAYARHLLRKYDGESVVVRWIAHRPLDPFHATIPVNLKQSDSYTELLVADQRRSDLKPEATGRAGAGSGGRQDVGGPRTGAER